jgi:hypothetical protein
MENRNGLIVLTELLQANGTAERDAALLMLEQVPGAERATVGADKAYDTRDLHSDRPVFESIESLTICANP